MKQVQRHLQQTELGRLKVKRAQTENTVASVAIIGHGGSLQMASIRIHKVLPEKLIDLGISLQPLLGRLMRHQTPCLSSHNNDHGGRTQASFVLCRGRSC